MTLRRMDHSGNAPQTTLQNAILAGDVSIPLAAGTGYPVGTGTGPFVIVVDPGLAGEEKILCSSRSGNTCTVSNSPAGRGYDGTAASGHAAGAFVQHVYTAVEADDANDHVYTPARDDHTNYAKADGTRAFTGQVTVSAGGAAITGPVTVTGTENVSGALTGASSVTGQTVVSSGMTGATAASRYVGATASGAPISGTFTVGDMVIDQTGTEWICTAAGTPGTWSALAKDSAVVHLAGTETVTGAKTFTGGITGPLTVTGNETVSGTVTAGGALVQPPGLIQMYGAAAAPTGWLLCDGSAVSRTTFAALFGILGTTWGIGDGSTTFTLPDLRGRVPVGTGTGSGLTARALAATGGEEAHVLTVAEGAVHKHTIANPIGGGHLVQVEDPTGSQGLMVAPSGNKVQGRSDAATDNTGSGTAHNNMQPFAAVTYIIKT